jgi:hypothetical protein
MSSWRDAGAVALNGTVRVTNPRSTEVAQAPGFVRRTAIKLSGRVNELTDGTICAVDAATGAALGPSRESRIVCFLLGFSPTGEREERLLGGEGGVFR